MRERYAGRFPARRAGSRPYLPPGPWQPVLATAAVASGAALDAVAARVAGPNCTTSYQHKRSRCERFSTPPISVWGPRGQASPSICAHDVQWMKLAAPLRLLATLRLLRRAHDL
jgi:hypothetical protein